MSDVTILVTNGGPHPPDKWAALAAEKIANLIQVDELSDSDTAAQARKAKPRFEIAVSDALEEVFRDAMTAEREAVNSGTVSLRHAPFSVEGFADQALSAVTLEAEGTPFAAHFSNADVQVAVRNILKQNIIDAANIQRSWALDLKGL